MNFHVLYSLHKFKKVTIQISFLNALKLYLLLLIFGVTYTTSVDFVFINYIVYIIIITVKSIGKCLVYRCV